MSNGIEAFGWGIASALSLPAGALLGLWLKPTQKINSAFMAFGAGALLFALTIELFGHVPHEVEHHGMLAMLVAGIGALLGGFLFDGLNHILNNRGAYLRRLSHAKKYVARLKLLRARKLVEELSAVKVLNSLPPAEIAGLLLHLKSQSFKAGEKVFSQGDQADELYFILSGEVEVVRHENSRAQPIATLKKNDVFGEMGLLLKSPRTADVVAKDSVRVYKLHRKNFEELILRFPHLQEQVEKLASDRIDDLSSKTDEFKNQVWKNEVLQYFESLTQPVSLEEVKEEGKHATGHSAGGAALAIWLGIAIDGIPESLVIGMLTLSTTGMSIAFIAGVFLANMPEAMSSSVSMKSSGMKLSKILVMWGSITLLTGIGAYIGATAFPANPTGNMYYFVLGIEGLAAGAMLTMIAETMLPEAFEQGGSIVGISTLTGFLAALLVKVSF